MLTLSEILVEVRTIQAQYGNDAASEILGVLVTNESTCEAETIYNMATFAVGDYSLCYPLPYFDCVAADGAHLHVHEDQFNQLLDILEACI